MTAYRVWDSLNSEREEAVTIEAMSPDDAAETYAEGDRDGHIDGLYEISHPIAVEDPCGTRWIVDVILEMDPRWRATSCKEVPDAGR